MEFENKVLKLTKKDDPRTWWREYPPKFFYRDVIISGDKIKKNLENSFNDKDKPISIYIHIPFCLSRCRFCKFYSEVLLSNKKRDEYLDSLEKELSFYGIDFKKKPIDSLYIGGGTPTVLKKKEWNKLFKIIHKFFVFKKDIQILTEGTPETSSLENLKILRNFGVNRFTIGVQSFDEAVLKKANRKHNIKDIKRAMNNIKKSGIPYVNLDILFGLVGETWDSYILTLKKIIELKPNCLSFMTLDCGQGVDKVYERDSGNSYFSKYALKSKIFSYLSYVLERAGYEMVYGFSDSTFILKGQEQAVNHSLLNRFKSNYVFGLGSTAYSSLGSLQYSMPLHIGKYILSVNEGCLPDFFGIEFNEDEYIRRYFILSYILWGEINKKDFQKRFKKKIDQVIDSKFRNLKRDKWIIDTGDNIIFLPVNSQMIEKTKSKYQNYFKNYGNQERSFLFCLKYFYSSKIINQYKKYLKTC
ncbi:MAG: coproporphyrinogen-III oxidase family protein [bacterium]